MKTKIGEKLKMYFYTPIFILMQIKLFPKRKKQANLLVVIK